MGLIGCGGSSASGGAGASGTQGSGAADIVMLGGAIMTLDPARPRATAMAISGDRIALVGSDAEVQPRAGSGTRVIRLDGRSVTPGLVDGHAHLYGLGVALESVSVRGMTSEVEAAKRVAKEAASRPAGEWITGRGWDQNLWDPPRFPSHATLDALVPDHPVVLRRIDGHAVWANAAAMKVAGVGKDTREPDGGRIVRDETGSPTGVFVDNAMDLVEAHVPAAAEGASERRILRGAEKAAASGLTCVHDMGISDATAEVYRRLASAGKLPLRVYAFLSADMATLEQLGNRRQEIDDGSAFFSMRAIKFFSDGALGSRGAAMLAPYSDDPGNSGNWVHSAEEIARAVMLTAEHGWQIGIHAIGDAGNRAVLDAFEKAIRRFPDRDLRFRVEHAQVLAPADIPRFGKLGVIAAMQPTHATSDMPWAEARIGPERIRGAYAWRAILDRGGRIACGSDFPVEDVAPLLGIYAAVTRQDPEGRPPGGWYPAQRMTLEEAVRCFTVEPAYAAFVETQRGRLREGYVADITVYDRALEAGASLLETGIDMTIVGGRVTFEREP